MTFGPRAEALIAAATEMGDDIPPDFIAPELLAECAFAHRAFHDLSSDRASGFGIGPIHWSSIDAYARRYGITDADEFEAFAQMIRVMDGVFLSHHSPTPSPKG